VAYCIATEIAFHNFTGLSIDAMDYSNPEHVVYLILSAISAYYQKEDKEAPIKDENLMYDAAPEEVVNAIKEIVALRAEFYKKMIGDKSEDTADDGKEKNA